MLDVGVGEEAVVAGSATSGSSSGTAVGSLTS